MMRKLITLAVAVLLLTAAIPVSLAESGHIKAYDGVVGCDSPFYGLKLFLEKTGENFAGSSDARLNMQMNHADQRIAEAYAALLANNTDAADAALHEYELELDEINRTLNREDIDDDLCVNVSERFAEHEHQFGYLANDTTLQFQHRERWMNATNCTEKFKNGRPFIYFNNTSYFIPPGHLKNGSITKVPPGLAKKGYVAPEPVVVNGSPVWPWDSVNGTFDHPYEHDLNKTLNKTLDKGNHGDSKGNANRNGNGNGNGKR